MRSSRRRFLKTAIVASAAVPSARAMGVPAGWNPVAPEPPAPSGSRLAVDASTDPVPVRRGHLRMGAGRRPDGRELAVDSRSLVLDGTPRLPVMGEIHYARYPDDEWREELLKMMAGGVEVAATYVFWIHHEEIEGTFDWSSRRSLRRFVELCGQVGLLAVVRCGPWCHGEVRNGGLPDWILRKGFEVRSDAPGYLSAVRRLYAEIAGQLQGLLWKDGGPVIAIQFENEYHGPAEHLIALKRIAREAGLDVPVYTRTGWPETRTRMPFGEMVPLFGSYAEGFWDRELTSMPGKYGESFLFKLARIDASVAMGPQAEDPAEAAAYPYFCCEIGGGMERSYHRRIRIAPADIEAAALVKLGCGNNLQGYYMYHGGTNPEGRLTTLQESQATNYWNDVPVKSYDFQAPLGEFGQVREHYHRLRRTHLFLRDYGSLLATLPPRLPEVVPKSPKDTATVRWAVRSDGRRGFVFVSNYQRLQPMPQKQQVQFQVRLESGPLVFPAAPFTVPADLSFFWAFNLELAGTTLVYATAQPVCRLDDGGTTYLVFAETTGVPAEFAFQRSTVTVEHASGQVGYHAGQLRVRNVPPGTGAALRLHTASGQRLSILLLDQPRSLACWKGRLAGRERIVLTRAGVVFEGDRLRLATPAPEDLEVSMLPGPASATASGSPLTTGRDGLFTVFRAAMPAPSGFTVVAEKVEAAGPAREIRKGSQGVAEAPSDDDFARAAVWRLRLSGDFLAATDALLRMSYVGDVARLYLDGRLLTDNFYNGAPFELGLRRFAPDVYRGELLLKILPLRRAAPIYLPPEAWPEFARAESAVELRSVEVIERHHLEIVVS